MAAICPLTCCGLRYVRCMRCRSGRTSSKTRDSGQAMGEPTRPGCVATRMSPAAAQYVRAGRTAPPCFRCATHPCLFGNKLGLFAWRLNAQRLTGSGRRGIQRSGIKGEPAGRRTAAQRVPRRPGPANPRAHPLRAATQQPRSFDGPRADKKLAQPDGKHLTSSRLVHRQRLHNGGHIPVVIEQRPMQPQA